MSLNFHEQFVADAAALPSDRSTGLVFATVALIVAVLWRSDLIIALCAAGVSAGFSATSLLAPSVLRPLNMLWFRFALLLNRIVSPIVMFVLFAVTIVPFGLAMHLRHDPLRCKRRPKHKSYLIQHQKGGAPADMANQF